ncbi:carbonic anhydrase 2 [Lingula anatina]|uniref:Carbonic anhydrase n=1 Tax=Lingula anatina TaxID=7574 RepID=A0A1S3JW83_LINAN|nr:carbonic anhydrase 2 [Lingula anatina]|eukprot:XP_013414685.1 carbonic anhydrase 2 [Lingula anatina]
MTSTFLSLLLCSLQALVNVSGWTYDGKTGVDQWAKLFAPCGGQKQSPINILSADAEEDLTLKPFKLNGYNSVPANAEWVIENNAHTVQVSIKSGEYSVQGGGLPRNYKLLQFHWHWGMTSKEGSEHTVNGKSYPMELHLVHYASNYTSPGDALDKTNGLAVLGFFIDVQAEDNPFWEGVVNMMSKVAYGGTSAPMPPVILAELLPNPDKLNEFYRYGGSLTTPGCFESVIWTVFTEPIRLSERQLQKFRLFLRFNKAGEAPEPMVNNYRPVQPLYDRLVYKSISDDRRGWSMELFLLLAVMAVACMFYQSVTKTVPTKKAD